jgi:hypothetical protein
VQRTGVEIAGGLGSIRVTRPRSSRFQLAIVLETLTDLNQTLAAAVSPSRVKPANGSWLVGVLSAAAIC